jgi:hypothetical protein
VQAKAPAVPAKAQAARVKQVARVAQANGVSTAEAEAMVTAQEGQAKAAALIRQRDALRKTGGDGQRIALLNTQISNLLASAWQTQAQAAKMMTVTWDNVASVVEFTASRPATARRGRTWDDLSSVVVELTGTAAGAAQDPRVPAGQPGGGTFGSGQSGQPQGKPGAKPGAKGAPKLTPHQQHVAHVAHQQNVSTQKAGLLVAAQDDRAKAAALIKQRDALVKALASAGGKTSSGQAGAKTATTSKTKSTAASTAKTGTTAAKTTAATAKTASTAAKTATSAATSAAGMKAQVAQLNTQITALLQQAAQATAQAAKLK